MRALIVLALLGGCAGPTRPSVIPMLSELPADPQKRDAMLDSAVAQPGPEQRKRLPSKQHKIETVAATAAAVIGGLFSKTTSVTLGAMSLVDANRLFEPPPPPRRAPRSEASEGEREGERQSEGDEKPAAAPAPADRPAELVPWVRLK